jgi:transcriptional regulator with XRE-family HTH domain
MSGVMRFANEIRIWRRKRGFSQERLGFEANVSARHIAFMETERARPSREMVLRLSEALDVPRRDRNILLEAAGFAPVYVERSLAESDMENIRQAMAWMLNRHDPFPAFAIDRHWRVLMLNGTAAKLFSHVGIKVGDSLIEAVLAPVGLRQAITNWKDTAHYFVTRLRTESRHLGGDSVLEHAASRLTAEAGEADTPFEPKPAVLQTHYRVGAQTLAFFSTIAQFGSAEDLALADTKIEFLFPADEATRMTLMNPRFVS